MIPYSRQHITDDDINAVVAVLKSDFLTQGPCVSQFEQSIVDHCDVPFAVATTNATSALHTACLVLNINERDLVWVSAVSFVASANCARYCGASIDFVDIDPATGLLCLNALKNKLKLAAEEDRLPSALVVVHLAGQSCDMQKIAELCAPYAIRIIEDASHALGASYQNVPVGSCSYSDFTVFSFHPVKPITSAEGGMLTTKNPEFARLARLYVSHGVVRDSQLLDNTAQPGWYYEQQVLGYNFRLSDLHAALGVSQMMRLKERTQERAQWADYLDKGLGDLPLKPLSCLSYGTSSHHLYIVRVATQQLRDRLYQALKQNGFGVNLHYIPIFLHPYYQQQGPERQGYELAAFPGAMHYYETALSLPLFAGIKKEVLDAVLATIKKVCADA